ncbi:hypothetical protein [Bradyrhizobium arachidis]|uniref:Uncharacterized protein n=1 Tax=Bradyrhizobium arachidis TaxID=858423 RepID=A0AAE7TG53_9BRAD|nr:hypothetical protein [Bradyrhizobium arachidis]QOZ67150.1 hypothetical protein WN72_13115 [Bradyrhizobium arachidis]SFV15981.1 hypothetical protein SAMN05192541_124108 [Bradyrhizobium arachidis]
MTPTNQISPPSPVLNFAYPISISLSQLLEAFWSAEREVRAASDAIAKFPTGAERTPQVRGGVTKAMTILTNGEEPSRIPSRDWFYNSIEEIDQDHTRALKNAATDDERDGINARFAGYREEYARQKSEIVRSTPKGKRAAERREQKALRALERAEISIINYEPRDLDEAAQLLEFACRGESEHCFTADGWELQAIMRNVATTIRTYA